MLGHGFLLHRPYQNHERHGQTQHQEELSAVPGIGK
jgi:hypothetical protein